jgi:hypothetical protein
MTRQIIWIGMLALATAVILPSVSLAFFPPNIGITPIPPDPFGTPGTGGLGEPEPPDPGPGPNVQTPEPATVVTALVGLAMAGAYGVRKRAKARIAA